jgi:uroporphyrinogen-III decarboxylase
MKELIGFYVDWEIEYARLLLERWQPEVLFHHDDWGSANSTLLSVAMFSEFFLPAYKRLYGFYKDNGIQLIVHHSDSYAATLVPLMIEMGIDIYQGCMSTNNTPELVRQYGGQISFMGDIDNRVVDTADWSEEVIAREVERACRSCGRHYFIPDLIIGGPGSVYPGVYDAVSRQIERMSKELF